MEGIHALNPELTGLVPAEDVYRIYAGLREEYAIDGRRVINTQDIRLCRRIKQDVNKRGRTLESVLKQYQDTVKPMHERYVEPSKKYANIVVPEGGKNLVALDMIVGRIQRHLEET